MPFADAPDLDTQLARLLHAEGRLGLDEIKAALERARAARATGLTLARLLVAGGRLTQAEVEQRLDQLQTQSGQSWSGSGSSAPHNGQDASRAFAPGSRFGGYVVVRELGRGGMGSVLLATQLETGAARAVKVVPLSEGQEFAIRFQREAQAMARVDGHPNVVRVFDCGQHAGHLYLVMEVVDGGDLDQRLKVGGAFAPQEAANLIEQLALGLAHVHGQGVLHRDLKPANVLLTQDGTPKLTDFGLARVAGGDALTQTGTILGSPAFMAPEQVEGQGALDERTDVYGLGAVLYSLLYGQAPFGGQGESVLAVLQQVLETPPRDAQAGGPRVPPSLEAICLKCLAKPPDQRYGSARELAEELARFGRGELRGASSRRAWIAGALVLAGVSGVAALGLRERAPSTAAEEVRGPRDTGPGANQEPDPDGQAREAYLQQVKGGLDLPAYVVRERLDELSTDLSADALADLRIAKQDLLDAEDQAWSRAFEERLAEGGARGMGRVEALGAIVWASPGVAVPTATRRVLLEARDRMIAGPPPRDNRAAASAAALLLACHYALREESPPREAIGDWRDRGVRYLTEPRPLELHLLALQVQLEAVLTNFSDLSAAAGSDVSPLQDKRPESGSLFLVHAAHLQRVGDDQGAWAAALKAAIDAPYQDLAPFWIHTARVDLRQVLMSLIASPDQGEGLLRQYREDMAWVARGLVANPAFAKESHVESACLYGALAMYHLGRPGEGKALWLDGLGLVVGKGRFNALYHASGYMRLIQDPLAFDLAQEARSLAADPGQSMNADRALAQAYLDVAGFQDPARAEEHLGQPGELRARIAASLAFAETAIQVALVRGDLEAARRRLDLALASHAESPTIAAQREYLEAQEAAGR
jgi:Protein kinase domain